MLLQSPLLLGLLGGDLSLVELQLLSFQKVAISTATLSWAGRDGGKQTTLSKLLSEERVDLAVLAPEWTEFATS